MDESSLDKSSTHGPTYQLEVSYWDWANWTPFENSDLDDPLILSNIEWLKQHAQAVARPGVRYRIVQVMWESPHQRHLDKRRKDNE